MATMVELVQRTLMNRPTVALISETAIRLVGSSPTRASDPRTEITRPKEIGAVETDMVSISCASVGQTMRAVVGETVKPVLSNLRQVGRGESRPPRNVPERPTFSAPGRPPRVRLRFTMAEVRSWRPIDPFKRADVLHGNRLCAGQPKTRSRCWPASTDRGHRVARAFRAP